MTAAAPMTGFYIDPRLAEAGFVAGVTTRDMGNMADAGNRAKALELAGIGHQPSYFHKQVHGAEVVALAAATPDTLEADGWLVDAGGKTAIVYAADCMPLFVWERTGRAGAVLHSGWKGTKSNIAAVGAKLVGGGDLRAYIGAHIGPCCYAVGEDFTALFRPESLERRHGKLYLDLGAEARAQFIEAGVPAAEIVEDKACTACSGKFFSFRREKSGTRMMGFLAKRHG